MNVQLGMGIAGNAVLIVSAICVLIEWPLIRCDWAAAAGMPLGWLALAGSVAAVAYRAAQQDRRLSASRRADRDDGRRLAGLHGLLVSVYLRQWCRECRVGLSHVDARLGRLCLIDVGLCAVCCPAFRQDISRNVARQWRCDARSCRVG